MKGESGFTRAAAPNGMAAAPSSALKCPVNKIIPISTVDGPGARTAIFLQGCNIACRYCHNPETQNLCIHCGQCVGGCPTGALRMESARVVWNPAQCVNCDQCLQACQHFASPKVLQMTVGQVMEEVRKNIPFIRGISVSGGECMLYPDFLTELFTLAKGEGLTCLIDTNGSIPFAESPALLRLCDGVMLDIKAWDPVVYAALVGGGDNTPVKKNLALLAEQDKITELRVVCLPEYMDAEGVISGIAETIGTEKAAEVRLKLIRFRPNGVKGELAKLSPPGDETMKRLQKYAELKGFANIIVV